MHMEAIRKHCLAFPHTTEQMMWDDDLVFKVAGKMFAVASTTPASPNKLSFKCTPEMFGELIERDGIIPAPYMARAQWVTLQRWDALGTAELKSLVRNSYDMVVAKLPKKVQNELGEAKEGAKTTKKTPTGKTPKAY